MRTTGKVPVRDHTHDVPRATTTDAAGRFALRRLSPGLYDLTASPRALEAPPTTATAAPPPRYASGTVSARAGEEGVRISLALAGAIAGIASEAATGKPVAGVRVVAEAERGAAADDAPPLEGTTGADGAFRIDGAPAGVYTLRVTPELHPSQKVGPVVVVEGECARADVSLGPPTEIAGVVLALPDRKPMPYVRVVGISREAHMEARRTGKKLRDMPGISADAEGRFSLRGLPPGEYNVIAVPANRPLGHAELELPEEGGRRVVEVLVPAGSVISGRVAGAATSGLGAWSVRTIEMAGAENQRAEVGADERYAIEGVSAGPHGVEASPSGSPEGAATVDVRQVRIRRWVKVVEGEESEVDIPIPPAERSRIVDLTVRRRGAPLPDGSVVTIVPLELDLAKRLNVRPEGGRYRVALRPGRYALTRELGALLGELVVPAVEGEVAVAVDAPAGSIAGRFVDPTSGTPIAGAACFACEAREPGASGAALAPLRSATAVTGRSTRAAGGNDGTFVIEDLAPGRYDVTLVVRGLVAARRGVEVADRRVDLGDVRAEAPRPLRGVVTAEGRGPVSRGVVTAFPGRLPVDLQRGAGGVSTQIGSDGAFAFDSLAPGPYVLRATSPSLSRALVEVEHAAGPAEVPPVAIALRGTGAARLQVFEADGALVIGPTIVIRTADGGLALRPGDEPYGMAVGAMNGLGLKGFSSGRYAAFAWSEGRVAGPLELVVEPGEGAEVRFTMPPVEGAAPGSPEASPAAPADGSGGR